MESLKKFYNAFVFEAENFFVKKFISSPTLEKEYSDCLDIVFDITKTVDSNRGLIAFNQRYGQGKSFFFDVILHLYKRNQGANLFKKITAKELAELYVATKNGDDPQRKLIEAISVKRLFIDDIGDEGEKKVFHNYANELNVIRFVLLKRYEFWKEKGWITYGTTNLTIDQIAKAYDGRVSDRLLEMCHWRKFEFLKDGSFRQIDETRSLTKKEIEANLEKFRPVEKEEPKIDREKYFNELVLESDEYFDDKDISFWTFVKDYLIEVGLMDQSQLKVDEMSIKYAKVVLRNDVRETYSKRFKHSPAKVRSKNIEEALKSINQNQILNVAENKKAREVFLKLRKNNHKF